MLYAPAGSIKPYRVQGAFVSDDEISAIVEHIKTSCGNAQYDSEIINKIKNSAAMQKKKRSSKKQADNEQDGGYLSDKQFLDAVEIAVNAGKISTPLLQRKLSIGFGKAVKFIDIMEDLGIVDVPNGQHPRVVLLTPEEWHEKLARASADET